MQGRHPRVANRWLETLLAAGLALPATAVRADSRQFASLLNKGRQLQMDADKARKAEPHTAASLHVDAARNFVEAAHQPVEQAEREKASRNAVEAYRMALRLADSDETRHEFAALCTWTTEVLRVRPARCPASEAIAVPVERPAVLVEIVADLVPEEPTVSSPPLAIDSADAPPPAGTWSPGESPAVTGTPPPRTRTSAAFVVTLSLAGGFGVAALGTGLSRVREPFQGIAYQKIHDAAVATLNDDDPTNDVSHDGKSDMCGNPMDPGVAAACRHHHRLLIATITMGALAGVLLVTSLVVERARRTRRAPQAHAHALRLDLGRVSGGLFITFRGRF